jgi:hypothetical protein
MWFTQVAMLSLFSHFQISLDSSLIAQSIMNQFNQPPPPRPYVSPWHRPERVRFLKTFAITFPVLLSCSWILFYSKEQSQVFASISCFAENLSPETKQKYWHVPLPPKSDGKAQASNGAPEKKN